MIESLHLPLGWSIDLDEPEPGRFRWWLYSKTAGYIGQGRANDRVHAIEYATRAMESYRAGAST